MVHKNQVDGVNAALFALGKGLDFGDEEISAPLVLGASAGNAPPVWYMADGLYSEEQETALIATINANTNSGQRNYANLGEDRVAFLDRIGMKKRTFYP